MGVVVHGTGLRLGLNFADTTPELFAGKEMGGDSLRVLQDYRKLYGRICVDIKTEILHVREAVV